MYVENAMRPTVRNLIVHGLGYCCPWFFFQCFRQTQVIADRLGCHKRTVRKLKSACDNELSVCENAGKCMKGHLPEVRRMKRYG